MTFRSDRRHALLAAAALGLAACGSSGSEQAVTGAALTATADTPETSAPLSPGSTPAAATTSPRAVPTGVVSATPTAAGPNELPRVTVLDLASGEEVSLDSFAPADTPLLIWFWAPH